MIIDRDIDILNILRKYPIQIIAELRVFLMSKGTIDLLRKRLRGNIRSISIYFEDYNGTEYHFCFKNGEDDLHRLLKWMI